MTYRCPNVLALIHSVHQAFLHEIFLQTSALPPATPFVIRMGVQRDSLDRSLGVFVGADAFMISLSQLRIGSRSFNPPLCFPNSHAEQIQWLLLHFLELQGRVLTPSEEVSAPTSSCSFLVSGVVRHDP